MISCTPEQEIINTGLVDTTPYSGSMYEYMLNDTLNFNYITFLIEKADLIDLFTGNVDSLAQITFFTERGFDIAIQLQRKNIDIRNISKEMAKNILFERITKGRILKNDIPSSKEGGQKIYFLNGNYLHFFTIKHPYMDMPEVEGPVVLYYQIGLFAYPVKTTNIQTKNGVIHRI